MHNEVPPRGEIQYCALAIIIARLSSVGIVDRRLCEEVSCPSTATGGETAVKAAGSSRLRRHCFAFSFMPDELQQLSEVKLVQSCVSNLIFYW